MTKKIPYVDRWHMSAKLMLFYCFIIPPLFFFIVFVILDVQVMYHNWCVDKKYEKLNKEMEE